MIRLAGALLLICGCSTAGQGSAGDAAPPAPATCESVATAICEKACACGRGDCWIVFSSGVIAFYDANDLCRPDLVAKCGEIAADDWDACRDAVASSSCVRTKGGDALAPLACVDPFL